MKTIEFESTKKIDENKIEKIILLYVFKLFYQPMYIIYCNFAAKILNDNEKKQNIFSLE